MFTTENRVALVLDDHRLFADSFAKLLEQTSLFRIVPIFYNEKDLLQYLISFRTSDNFYIFADYFMENRNLPVFYNDLKRAGKNLKIIVVTSLIKPALLHELLLLNPNGVISKSAQADEVIACMDEVSRNKKYISPGIQELLTLSPAVHGLPFTPREIEILHYFEKGYSVNETANFLHLSPHTISAHRRKMMSKAKVKSITALLSLAREYDIL